MECLEARGPGDMPTSMRQYAAVASFVALAGLATAAAPPARASGLQLADLRRVVHISEPAIAPDGRSVAYVRSTNDYKANRSDSEIVLVNVRSGAGRVLTRDHIAVRAPIGPTSGPTLRRKRSSIGNRR